MEGDSDTVPCCARAGRAWRALPERVDLADVHIESGQLRAVLGDLLGDLLEVSDLLGEGRPSPIGLLCDQTLSGGI